MITARETSAAHRFVARRRRAALIAGAHDGYADLAVPKNRGLLAGAVCSVLTVAAAFGYVWFAGPSLSEVPTDGVVKIADSGATYLMIDGVAHPTLNTASALLADDSTTTVDEQSLSSTPRGAPVGIPGAPDDLPAPESLTHDSWAMCAEPEGRPVVLVGVGTLAPLPTNQAVLLQSDTKSFWLVAGDQRHQVDHNALAALGITADLAVPTTEATLGLIPQASELDADAVPEHVSAVVVKDATTGPSYFALVGGGMAPLTPTAAALLTEGPPGPAPSEAPAAAISIPPDWPTIVPQALELGDRAFCASDVAPYSAAVAALPPDGLSLVDELAAGSAVAIAPGAGALVQLDEAAESEYLLVTDSGLSYEIDDAAALRRLGYQPEDAIVVASSLIDTLPRGPRLGIDAARSLIAAGAQPGGTPDGTPADDADAPTLER